MKSILDSKEGFTVIEVLMSVSIAGLIMAVVTFGYSTFNDNLAIGAAGQELAIAVREAQTYGLTVKEVVVGGGNFSTAYGVYFDLNDPSNYYIFADTNGNNKYDIGSGCGSGSTECIEQFSLRNSVTITNVCDGTTCPPEGSVKMMDVTFLRPNPDANIYFTDVAGQFKVGPSTTGKVILTSAKGTTQTITIESTGQVLVR